jgi:hypothetical protein
MAQQAEEIGHFSLPIPINIPAGGLLKPFKASGGDILRKWKD